MEIVEIVLLRKIRYKAGEYYGNWAEAVTHLKCRFVTLSLPREKADLQPHPIMALLAMLMSKTEYV